MRAGPSGIRKMGAPAGGTAGAGVSCRRFESLKLIPQMQRDVTFGIIHFNIA